LNVVTVPRGVDDPHQRIYEVRKLQMQNIVTTEIAEATEEAAIGRACAPADGNLPRRKRGFSLCKWGAAAVVSTARGKGEEEKRSVWRHGERHRGLAPVRHAGQGHPDEGARNRRRL